MKGVNVPYTAKEEAWLRENGALPITDLLAAFQETFARADISKVNMHAKRKRMGIRTGRTGFFPKGHPPLNKGCKMPFNANSARTQFKKGQLSGRAAKVIQPIGAHRVSKDGYVQVKVNNDLPFYRRWRRLHLVNWEAVNGPLTQGMALKCLDGDIRNCDPANWHVVPRALLPRLNGGRWKKRIAFDDAPTELKPTLLATAKLEQAVFEKVNGRQAR